MRDEYHGQIMFVDDWGMRQFRYLLPARKRFENWYRGIVREGMACREYFSSSDRYDGIDPEPGSLLDDIWRHCVQAYEYDAAKEEFWDRWLEMCDYCRIYQEKKCYT